tara:strand:+ start:454 stop:1023 length:570 start_codon:yes stop_codon:yes gene_type:complete
MINPFIYLILSIVLNVFFILISLRDINDPIFINGNKGIIIFNFYLFVFFMTLKLINKYNGKFKFTKTFSLYNISSSILISALLAILFWSLFPSIIDRSLSVNILGTLYKSNNPANINQLNWSLNKNYMDDLYQVNKRISEQIQIGNIIEVKKNQYILSKKGRIWAKINIFISNYFKLDKRSSEPEFITF